MPHKVLLLLFDLPVVEIPEAVVVSNASLEVPKMRRKAMNFFCFQKKGPKTSPHGPRVSETCNALMHLLVLVHAPVTET